MEDVTPNCDSVEVPNLSQYDLVIINSSAGKDSLCCIYEVCRIADNQNYPKSNIVVSHQDLGTMEWPMTFELAKMQAEVFGLEFVSSKRRDKNGNYETLLEYAKRRGKWPSNNQRWCTSDLKRGPGARVVTALTKDLGECKVLYVFGFRKEESPARARKKSMIINTKLTTKRRTVYEWYPIHDWSTKKVWGIIHDHKLPYHKAYDLGMPRLSCVFCIFSPFDALVLAGIENPNLLDEYVRVEKEIGHTFKADLALADVKKAIDEGYEPKTISNWTM